MTESEQQAGGVLETGMSVASAVDGGVVVVHFDLTDPVGTFRIRRGANLQEAYAAQEEQVHPEAETVPWEWAVLADSGLEVKLLSAPGWGDNGIEDGPLRVAVRPRIKREGAQQ